MGQIYYRDNLRQHLKDETVDLIYFDLTGASTHPGAGVFAASGYNTARVILGER
jgi:phytoene dehydrogenase-like protein